MSQHLFALLLHDHPEPFEGLKRTLRDLSVETYSVSTCKEAMDLIAHCKPHVIFSENSVVDGSWVSVLNMAEAAEVPLSVIVVGDHPDSRHYLSIMERGAFDFVAPPFEHEPLNFVVKGAALDAHRRRVAAAVASVGH
jgi:DNA-binding NtrC family response regulator